MAWIMAGAIVCALMALTLMLAQPQRGATGKEFMWDKLERPQLSRG